jgi:hypothetical protein
MSKSTLYSIFSIVTIIVGFENALAYALTREAHFIWASATGFILSAPCLLALRHEK